LLAETLGTGLYGCHWTDLFLLSAIAGFSEELLFRGLLQPWMESAWGMAAGLLGSNLIFGLVHAVTPWYALLAALVGVYLGLALDYGGGLYDFVVFLVIKKSYSRAADKR
jgi:hypothetical protein